MKMGDGPNDAGLSRQHLIKACEASLKRLGTEWIDLYQLHEWDGQTPREETLRALDDLVRSGKHGDPPPRQDLRAITGTEATMLERIPVNGLGAASRGAAVHPTALPILERRRSGQEQQDAQQHGPGDLPERLGPLAG